MTNADDVWRDVFVTGLKNAHAVESQALALMDRQIDRSRNFTEVADRLKAHRLETEEQTLRLETLPDGFDEKPSGLKDAALSIGGDRAAISHGFAGDEVLKKAFANSAFETFETASFQALILPAESVGYSTACDPLADTRQKEARMARRVDASLPVLGEKHLDLRRAGENASR